MPDTMEGEMLLAWRMLPADQKRLVRDLVHALAEHCGGAAVSVQEATPARVSRTRMIHAVLKLGQAKGEHGIITPWETIDCVEQGEQTGKQVWLATNSQAVSASKRGSIGRLYLLIGDEVEMVLDVADVRNQEGFEASPESAEALRCPEGMKVARTWFKVTRFWRPAQQIKASDIYLLSEPHRTIENAIRAGRATFFYCQPIPEDRVAPTSSA